MERTIPSSELRKYMEAQMNQITREYGAFNNETAKMFIESGKSRKFRENYKFQGQREN